MVFHAANRNLTSAVTQQSIQFSTALYLPVDFLQIDPSQWCYNSEFKTELKYVKGLKVGNDTAERVVALIQEFNADLTRNEEQKQLLIQMVAC